jgi:hypothetical protein
MVSLLGSWLLVPVLLLIHTGFKKYIPVLATNHKGRSVSPRPPPDPYYPTLFNLHPCYVYGY